MIDTILTVERVSEIEDVKLPLSRKKKLPQQVSRFVQKRLIGMEECAAYLGITVGSLYVWVHQRKIPYIKVGKLVKFDLIAIDAWLKERTVACCN